uniref:Uncharacterized protein n=1 Tax=Arundo donax TaxID=35708 RepID=A0A0A9FKR7_ARUDO
MLLSCAGSCGWESKASTLWQLSTAVLFASSTSSIIHAPKTDRILY